jgi:hypothetical protein
MFKVCICNEIDSREKEESEEDNVDDIILYGQPVNVLNVTDKNEFEVDSDGINRIFMRPDLKDRKIVAVSVVGIFRKGKSFLLNYFLRYLYGNVSYLIIE